MQNLIIVWILFLATFAQAKVSHLSCSKSGSYFVFINGININDTAYELLYLPTQRNILNALKSDRTNVDSKGNVDGDVFRNTSEGFLKDLAETYFLWLESQGYSKDIYEKNLAQFVRYFTKGKDFYKKCSEYPQARPACEKILELELSQPSTTASDLGKIKASVAEKIQEGKKIVFVTHSAGSSYADNVRDYLETYFPDANKVAGLLAVAPSFTSRHPNYYHFTFKSDQLVNFVRFWGDFIPGVDPPKGNYDAQIPCPMWDGEKNWQIPAGDHDINCYFQDLPVKGSTIILDGSKIWPASKMIVDAIQRVASKLPNNDENCCNKAPGKMWRNDELCVTNPEVCQTSFIANSTKLFVNNASILNNSQICGNYTVKSTAPSYFTNTKMYGSGSIIAEANDLIYMLASTLNEKSFVESKVKSLEV